MVGRYYSRRSGHKRGHQDRNSDSVVQFGDRCNDFELRSVLSAPIAGLPDKLFTCLNYHEHGKISGTSVRHYNYRANSLYNPSSTAHQPMFFDQLANLYERFKVLACKATIMISNTNGVNEPIEISTSFSNQSLASTDIITTSELPNATYNLVSSSSSKNMCKATIVNYSDMNALAGIPKESFAMMDNYWHTGTAAPGNVLWFNIVIGPKVQNNDFAIDVHLKYYVKCYSKLYDVDES